MKNIKELVTKFNLLSKIKEYILMGELCVPLKKIEEELGEAAAAIAAAITEQYNATVVAEAFGGCDDPELAFIKAEALMGALDAGVTKLNRMSKLDELDVEIIGNKVLISAYRDIKDIENRCESIYSEKELKEAKTVVGPHFLKIATEFSEFIRALNSRRRHDAIDKITIAYVNAVIEIYNGDK